MLGTSPGLLHEIEYKFGFNDENLYNILYINNEIFNANIIINMRENIIRIGIIMFEIKI